MASELQDKRSSPRAATRQLAQAEAAKRGAESAQAQEGVPAR